MKKQDEGKDVEAQISLLRVVHDTMVDGPGFRTSVYCAGCVNQCPGCHNPQSWDIHNGTLTPVSEIMREIMSDPFAHVTFTGGDPMYQPQAFTALAKSIRQQSDKTIWCYTGYTLEHILKDEAQRELLAHIDVLVDGPFVQKLRDPDLVFRGSSNQRILNAAESLKQGKAVEEILDL